MILPLTTHDHSLKQWLIFRQTSQMSYSIHITATAERDILRAADYIEFTLKNPHRSRASA